MLLKALVVAFGAASASKTHVMTSKPVGNYKGSKTVLGEKIKATIDIKNATHLDLIVKGATSLTCLDEPYTFQGRDVVLADTSASDCVERKLEKKHAAFKGATYDMQKNTLTVDVQLHEKKVTGGERKIDVSLELDGE